MEILPISHDRFNLILPFHLLEELLDVFRVVKLPFTRGLIRDRCKVNIDTSIMGK